MRRTEFSAVQAAAPLLLAALVANVTSGCQTDQIAHAGFTGTKDAIALIDGRRARGCVSFEVARGRDVIKFRNLRASDGCPSRVAIFSDSHSVAYLPSVSWTTTADESLPVTANRSVSQPIQFWLLYDPCTGVTSGQCDARGSHLTDLIALHANLRDQFSGIELQDLGLIDRSDTDVPIDFPGCRDAVSTGATLDRLATVTGRAASANQLNVFYVRNAGGESNAWWCGVHDPAGASTILVPSGPGDLVLQHEIGHALLGLGSHVDFVAGFPNQMVRENLMAKYFVNDSLTIGQLYRASMHKEAAINRNRDGTTPGIIDCDDPPADAPCPALSVDVNR